MNTTLNILAAGETGGTQTIIMMVLMFVIFWVVLIRPQQKQRKELAAKQSALKKGDKVITVGGMHATVNAVNERSISLRLAEGIFVKFDKTSIASVNPEKGADAAPKAKQG